jgi:hypothetical protein
MTGSIKGEAVHFDDRYLHVELEDGRVISTPMEWYKDLQSATLQELGHYTFICRGTGIEWLELDYHLSIESMLAFQAERRVA